MGAFNRATQQIERRDFIDERAAGQTLLAGARVSEPVMAEDADGNLFQVDIRDKWAVNLNGETTLLGLNIDQMNFLERVQARDGRLGDADVQRLLVLAPQMVEPFLDQAAARPSRIPADLDQEAAEATAARTRYEAFIAQRVAAQQGQTFMCNYRPREGVAAPTDTYIATYLGLSAESIAADLPRREGKVMAIITID